MAPRPKVYHRICHVCHVDKPVAEFPKYSSKCSVCVAGKAKGKLITCVQCGQVKKLCARGMCNRCYGLAHPRSQGHCIKCQRIGTLITGLCASCYSNYRYHKDPQTWLVKQRQWQKSNPEKVKAGYRKRYQKRKASGYEQERSRLYYIRHPDKVAARSRSWGKRHRDLRVHYTRRREARMAGLVHDLTQEQWHAILKQYNYACAYCGRKVKPLHREHKIPIVHGGGYTASNIVPACIQCNSRKGTKTDDEYREYLKKFPD